MKGTHKARAFNAKYRDNPEAVATYLNKALATGDPVLATKAIDDVIRAQGMTKVAQKAGSLPSPLHPWLWMRLNHTLPQEGCP